MTSVFLEISQGIPEFHHTENLLQLYFAENLKVLFADLSQEKVSKSLLNDIHQISEEIKAEELIISIAAGQENCNSIVRDLLVFGFEMMNPIECQKYTSKNDCLFLKMEVNSEYDFVDLV